MAINDKAQSPASRDLYDAAEEVMEVEDNDGEPVDSLEAFGLEIVDSAVMSKDGFTIDMIDDALFDRIYGKSFKKNCTVPRDDLRYLTILYYGLDAEEHKGEIICNKKIASDLQEIFWELYLRQYPIESVRLIDEFDADDEKSMEANNTSCFNYRTVAGQKKLSKHAEGMAIDINPLYNPYVKERKDGSSFVQPEAGRPYISRGKDFPMKIDKNDLCYKLFKEHGFTWGGDWKSLKDYQHFEK